MPSIRFLWTAARMGFDAWMEGRLSMSPRRWLIDLRHLNGRMRGPTATTAPRSPAIVDGPRTRESYHDEARRQLRRLLASNERMSLSTTETPVLSILIVVFNQAELTLRCLCSIAAHVHVPYEVVLIDNGSTDQTGELLARIGGLHVGRFPHNVGFLHGANTAALAARGRVLLFLNNDVELLAGSVESALATLERFEGTGAVGGRLVLIDGTLQEAGSIIWRDGSCQGYGRGDEPDSPEYLFVRDVDFVSGAFLLTPRALFDRLDGFDPAYAPAYYEDADYCVRLWRDGLRVLYDPGAVVRHLEFGSSSPGDAARRQQANRAAFIARHHDWLTGQFAAEPSTVLEARARRPSGQRILVIDDRWPSADSGFGFPRALDLIEALVADGHAVTLYATDTTRALAGRGTGPSTVEVFANRGWPQIEAFLHARRGHYDVLLVSRPHNLGRLRQKLGPPHAWCPPARVVYDAEAVAAVREEGRRRLLGHESNVATFDREIDNEAELARGTSAIIVVSDAERRLFERRGLGPIRVAAFALAARPTARSFGERSDLLFVGSFDELSPNTDAVTWFAAEILPLVRASSSVPLRLVVVGRHAPAVIRRLDDDAVVLFPDVTELVPFYERARVFVAPTRFAAGLPYKVAHAAAHGVPVVCTSLLARQLEWRHGTELLAADDARGFATACLELYDNEDRWHHIRDAALARVATDYAPARFQAAIRAAIAS